MAGGSRGSGRTSKSACSDRKTSGHASGLKGTASQARKNSGFVSAHRFSDAVSSSKSDAPLGAAEKLGFVSGYRFSDTVSPSKSDAPLGACGKSPGGAT